MLPKPILETKQQTEVLTTIIMQISGHFYVIPNGSNNINIFVLLVNKKEGNDFKNS